MLFALIWVFLRSVYSFLNSGSCCANFVVVYFCVVVLVNSSCVFHFYCCFACSAYAHASHAISLTLCCFFSLLNVCCCFSVMLQSFAVFRLDMVSVTPKRKVAWKVFGEVSCVQRCNLVGLEDTWNRPKLIRIRQRDGTINSLDWLPL